MARRTGYLLIILRMENVSRGTAREGKGREELEGLAVRTVSLKMRDVTRRAGKERCRKTGRLNDGKRGSSRGERRLISTG